MPCLCRSRSTLSSAFIAIAKRRLRENRQPISQFRQPIHIQQRRFSKLRHIRQQRSANLPRKFGELLLRFAAPQGKSRPLPPPDIVFARSTAASNPSTARASVRPTITKFPRPRARDAADLIFRHHRSCTDQFFPRQMPASLGRNLILDLHPGQTRLGESFHRFARAHQIRYPHPPAREYPPPPRYIRPVGRDFLT